MVECEVFGIAISINKSRVLFLLHGLLGLASRWWVLPGGCWLHKYPKLTAHKNQFARTNRPEDRELLAFCLFAFPAPRNGSSHVSRSLFETKMEMVMEVWWLCICPGGWMIIKSAKGQPRTSIIYTQSPSIKKYGNIQGHGTGPGALLRQMRQRLPSGSLY